MANHNKNTNTHNQTNPDPNPNTHTCNELPAHDGLTNHNENSSGSKDNPTALV